MNQTRLRALGAKARVLVMSRWAVIPVRPWLKRRVFLLS